MRSQENDEIKYIMLLKQIAQSGKDIFGGESMKECLRDLLKISHRYKGMRLEALGVIGDVFIQAAEDKGSELYRSPARALTWLDRYTSERRDLPDLRHCAWKSLMGEAIPEVQSAGYGNRCFQGLGGKSSAELLRIRTRSLEE